jgi:hypothetical protein
MRAQLPSDIAVEAESALHVFDVSRGVVGGKFSVRIWRGEAFQLRDLACTPLDSYAVLSARSSPSSLPPIFGSFGCAVFCDSAGDLLAPDGGLFGSVHKLQPFPSTEASRRRASTATRFRSPSNACKC